MKTIFNHGAWTSAMSIMQALVGFAISILLARLLGPFERGAYALAFLIIGTAGFVANPCIYSAANYFLSSEKVSLEKIFFPVFILALLSGIIACLLALVGGAWLMHSLNVLGYSVWLLTGIGAAMYAIGLSFNGIFYGLRKIKMISIWTIISGLLQLTLILTLSTIVSTPISLFITSYVVILTLDVLVKIILIILMFNEKLMMQNKDITLLLHYGGSVYSGRLLMLLAQRVDTYILYLLAGQVALGYYSIATSFGEQLWMLPSAINLVMMTNIARRVDDDAAQVTAHASRIVLALTFIASIVLGTFGPFIIPVLYGKDYTPAINPFLILLPGVVAISCYMLLEPFFQSRGKPLLPVIITSSGMVINIILSVALVYKFNIYGAAVAYTVSYVAQLIVACWIFSKSSKMSLFSPIDVSRAFNDLIALMRLYLNRNTKRSSIQDIP